MTRSSTSVTPVRPATRSTSAFSCAPGSPFSEATNLRYPRTVISGYSGGVSGR